jgi:hypothetical protein
VKEPDMSPIVRRTATATCLALACAVLPFTTAHAAGDNADPGNAAMRPADTGEAQLTGGPQAYDDIYQDQVDGKQRPAALPGMQAVRNATPEEHMLTAPGVPQGGGNLAAPARKNKATLDDPYAVNAGPQPYGLGAGAHPVYRLPY